MDAGDIDYYPRRIGQHEILELRDAVGIDHHSNASAASLRANRPHDCRGLERARLRVDLFSHGFRTSWICLPGADQVGIHGYAGRVRTRVVARLAHRLCLLAILRWR